MFVSMLTGRYPFVFLESFEISSILTLKVQSCKLYNNTYMVTSTQITNAEIFSL